MPFWKAHTSLFGPARVLHSAAGRVFVTKVREGSHRQHASGVCSPEIE